MPDRRPTAPARLPGRIEEQEVGLEAHFSFRDVMTDTVDLMALIEPEVRSLGYDLVDLELHLGRSGVLRLFIDSEDGITLDDCERVSHQVSGLLDVEDPIPGHYVLEVSSPGVNRKLRTREHFERFAGERVKVELRVPREDGRRRFTGILTDIGEDDVGIEMDGDMVRVALDDIASAKLAPEIKV